MKNTVIKEILDWVIHIGIAVIIGFLIVTFVAQITLVNGSSMENTLYENDRLIIEKISTRFGTIKRGDIVTVNNPEGDDGIYLIRSPIIKRVIGVAGDLVEIRDGKVYVNDVELKEDYIKGDWTFDVIEINSKVKVREGYVYVLGDNRLKDMSEDSRKHGAIKIKYIGGKAILRFFPFNRFGVLKEYNNS